VSSDEQKAWEYRVIECADEDGLNALGREGWELVGPASIGRTDLVFKRPMLSFREQVTLDQKRRYYALWGVIAGSDDKGAER
jgi:hypothetical protein